MSNLLMPGDIIYPTYHGKILPIHRPLKIERVTATMAFADNNTLKFDRKYNEGQLYKKGDYTVATYYLETHALKQQYERVRLIEKLKSIDWATLSTDTLQTISNLIL